MADFLKNKAKLIILAYGVVIALLIVFSLVFMTQYAHIHVAYSLAGGELTFTDDLEIGASVKNTDFFQYFSAGSDTTSPVLSSTNIQDACKVIYDFQVAMSSYNSLILIFGILSIVCFAVMLIFSNQSRKVYYKDNLAIGILMPLIVIIFTFILFIQSFGLMGKLNDNLDLFKVATLYMSPDVQQTVKQNGMLSPDATPIGSPEHKVYGFEEVILANTTGVNSLTFILGIVLYVLVIVCSIFIMVYTVYRYKECAKRRSDIIERAANNND